jgi:hypothetical protein
MATVNPDGSIEVKFGWWRSGGRKIRISGRRLDAHAPPLRAHVPGGYGRGFQATGLTFPTAGCWSVMPPAGTHPDGSDAGIRQARPLRGTHPLAGVRTASAAPRG